MNRKPLAGGGILCPAIDESSRAGDATPVCPKDARAAKFDPFQDAYMEDPSEFVRWAREQAPIFYSPKLGYWVVTRYQAIKDIFRDPVTFSPANVLEPMGKATPESIAALKSYGFAMSRTLVNEDEPTHVQRRRALMTPFTPNYLREHEPMVHRLVTAAIDQFMGRGRVDLFRELCWEVPFSVAINFLGVDDDKDRDRMQELCIAYTKTVFGRPTDTERLEIANRMGQFWQLAGEVLEKMRRTPDGPGWMRYSIRQQQHHPEVVTDAYLHSMMMAIIVAAHESTSYATANAVKTLLEHREAWDDLCADPTLLCAAVEECLRHNGPIASWRRRATREVNVEGVDLPAGTNLLLVVASADHDPRQFADPEFFDIRRDNVLSHLTFGFGAHQCLGKNLARMELQVMIGQLTRRLPHMRLADQEFHYVHNLSFRGVSSLWVEWDPARNPERANPSLRADDGKPVKLGGPASRNLVREVEVAEAEYVTPDVVRLRLVARRGQRLPSWTAGSHVDIECGDTGLSRQYSLCGDPDRPGEWEVAILRDPASRGGSAWIHRYAKPGNILRMRGPRNHFQLDAATRHPLLIAGGIGITPILAMARRAQALGLDYELHYSISTRAKAAFLDRVEQQHANHLHLHVSDEGTRCDFERLLAQPDSATQIYACGPVRMLAALQTAVDRAGWDSDALHVEKFTNDSPALDPTKEVPFEVELRNSGLVLQVPPDKTVLDVLHASNIDVPSDCEEGLCGTCEVGVIAGDIDHRDSVLSPAERRANNRMMSCCSRCACSGRLVLDL